MSRQVTSLPSWARHAPVTSPAYPAPTTQILACCAMSPPYRSASPQEGPGFTDRGGRPWHCAAWLDRLLAGATPPPGHGHSSGAPPRESLVRDAGTKGLARCASPVVVVAP